MMPYQKLLKSILQQFFKELIMVKNDNYIIVNKIKIKINKYKVLI